MSERSKMSFSAAHTIAKQSIGLASPDHIGGPDRETALRIMDVVPSEHLTALARMAVAQRNTDGIDQHPDGGRGAVFAEEFMLSLLSEEQRDEVLGVRI